MQGDVGQCLQGKDKAVISANEAVLVPEHKCANISNPTKACVSEVHVSPPLFYGRERVVPVRSSRGHFPGHSSYISALSLLCATVAVEYDHTQ